MNLRVSGQCGWPDHRLEVMFGDQRFVLLPRTRENSASIHLETKSNDQLDEMTTVNRFLSVVSWSYKESLHNEYGWSGNPIPVAVPAPNLARSINPNFLIRWNPLPEPKQRLAVALYREAMSVNSLPYQFLGFFKIINILHKSGPAQVEWIRATLPKLTVGYVRERIAVLEKSEPYDGLIGQEWFHNTPSVVIPRLTGFISLQRAEMLLMQSELAAALSPRVYDEKFHILQAPDLFQKDLHYFRKQCDLRGSSVAAAFIDIDDFKKRFNSPYGHERVDRDVLPRFMETLESHVFARGYAYRQGGDEYLALLPSVSLESAISLLDELREKVASLQYLGISARTTVSIGICFVGQGCFLTDNEVREKAAKASAHAKEPEKDKPRKNCIGTYRGNRFRSEDLYVAAPA